MSHVLALNITPPVQACNAGLFISRGEGIHPTRVIDSHELIFVRSGTVGLFEGTCRFQVTAGQALLLRPGLRHGGTTPYPPDLSFYWIHFRLRSTAGRKHPAHGIRLPSWGTVSRPDRLTELYRHFLDDQETGRLTPETADLMMTLMLCEVADTRPAPTVTDDTSATLADRANLFLRLHFHERISASTIATALRCNPDYLGRVFQKAYGHTLTEALHSQRHQKARSLLLEGTQSIKEIAQDCGFDDTGYFRRLFRRQEGLSPTAFRRLYSHMHINVD